MSLFKRSAEPAQMLPCLQLIRAGHQKEQTMEPSKYGNAFPDPLPDGKSVTDYRNAVDIYLAAVGDRTVRPRPANIPRAWPLPPPPPEQQKPDSDKH
jgi:hypothetical protein